MRCFLAFNILRRFATVIHQISSLVCLRLLLLLIPHYYMLYQDEEDSAKKKGSNGLHPLSYPPPFSPFFVIFRWLVTLAKISNILFYIFSQFFEQSIFPSFFPTKQLLSNCCWPVMKIHHISMTLLHEVKRINHKKSRHFQHEPSIRRGSYFIAYCTLGYFLAPAGD